MLDIYSTFFLLYFVDLSTCMVSYENHTLFRGIPVMEKHLAFFDSMTKHYKINIWRPTGALYKPVEFTVPPDEQKQFLKDAEERGIYLTTIMENVQSAFDKQTVKPYVRRRMDSFDWRNYFRIDDIYSWLKDLKKAYPQEVSVQSIGKTYEGRDIMAVRIFLKGPPQTRQKVMIEGGIHAREWIAPAYVTYLIHQIAHASNSTNEDLKYIARNYDWYFVPVLNPDGYEYSHKEDRLWRKNRFMEGVDLNRNFDVAFGSVGVSSDKKQEVYCGEKAFSERETRAMRDFVNANKKDLTFYISFHSYGQFIVLPYGHLKEHVENFNEIKNMSMVATARLHKLYRTKYTIGTAYDTVGYLVSGASTCWAKKTHKVPYAMTFELRDTGSWGFALPPALIKPTSEETTHALISLLTYNKTKDRMKINPLMQGAQVTLLDNFILLWNLFLFIIVRFD